MCGSASLRQEQLPTVRAAQACDHGSETAVCDQSLPALSAFPAYEWLDTDRMLDAGDVRGSSVQHASETSVIAWAEAHMSECRPNTHLDMAEVENTLLSDPAAAVARHTVTLRTRWLMNSVGVAAGTPWQQLLQHGCDRRYMC